MTEDVKCPGIGKLNQKKPFPGMDIWPVTFSCWPLTWVDDLGGLGPMTLNMWENPLWLSTSFLRLVAMDLEPGKFVLWLMTFELGPRLIMINTCMYSCNSPIIVV